MAADTHAAAKLFQTLNSALSGRIMQERLYIEVYVVETFSQLSSINSMVEGLDQSCVCEYRLTFMFSFCLA